MDMRVDLPEPDDPMTATNSPGSTTRSMPRNAVTSMSPTAKVRVTSTTLMIGCVMALSPSPAASEAQGRHCRSAAGRRALLGGDQLLAGMEVAADDLGEIL